MEAVKSNLLRQNDPEWKYHPFCKNGVLETHGCGPVAMSIALGRTDPRPMADWLTNNGYASSEYGTDHAGITQGLKAAGYPAECICTGANGDMYGYLFDQIIATLDKKEKVILLYGGPSTSCRTDAKCSAGHYAEADGIKRENGHIYVHTLDPIRPQSDGWFRIDDYSGTLYDSLNGNLKGGWKSGIPYAEQEEERVVQHAYELMPQSKEGSHGSHVYVLQIHMRARTNPETNKPFYQGEMDFWHGPELTQAVKAYQEARNKQNKNNKNWTPLAEDGIAGPSTWCDLYGGI